MAAMSEIDDAIDEVCSFHDVNVEEAERTQIKAIVGRAVKKELMLDQPRSRSGRRGISAIILRPDQERAVSIKLGNLALDPIKSVATSTGSMLLSTNISVPAAMTIPALGIPTLSLIAILAAAHLARKTDVKYEDACVLHAAWRVSVDRGEWRELSLSDLDEISELYPDDYRIDPPTPAERDRSVRRLCALGAMRAVADGKYQLLEEIRFA
jgi:hypothetical protein